MANWLAFIHKTCSANTIRSIRFSHCAFRFPMLWHDSATLAENIGLSAPEETATGVASDPDEKSSQIPQRVKPAKRGRTRVFRNSPAHHHRLNHAIHERHGQQADSQPPMSQASSAHESEHSKWHREGQPCAQMSGGPRITCALHPAQLVAERA